MDIVEGKMVIIGRGMWELNNPLFAFLIEIF